MDIPNVIQKSEIGQGGAQNLSQAKPAPKQHNLNKLCDAGGFKGCGLGRSQKPIFELRSVYTECEPSS